MNYFQKESGKLYFNLWKIAIIPFSENYLPKPYWKTSIFIFETVFSSKQTFMSPNILVIKCIISKIVDPLMNFTYELQKLWVDVWLPGEVTV